LLEFFETIIQANKILKGSYIYNIAGHFKGLYTVVIGGSLVFHLIYGALIGFISGRMTEIGVFAKKTNKITKKSLPFYF
jgi:hypothetical protein